MLEEVLKVFTDTLALQARQFDLQKDEYHSEFIKLLHKIYQNYELIIKDKIAIPKNENKIRDILVDDYLSKNITNYTFKKEEQNNLGRVDIFVQEGFTDEKPEFIIECKVLDDKNLNGLEGLNSKYIKNGIQRFITEHYFLENDFRTNAMIGFVVEKLNIVQNIESINILTDRLFNNIIEIKQKIFLEDNNTYKSEYITLTNGRKEFIVYHQMMDFSDNILSKEVI